ncbi:MAG: hypothetical protein JSW11_14935 [Candidatus Heimdallarchaeota archaeon]|nr:MAG: hypothetical protein JSW11_14935 [Candidatus Heimdallarchaeota archaeon]
MASKSYFKIINKSLDWLFNYPKQKTYLVVSHKPMVLQKADQIIVLKDGKVDAIGNVQSLLQSNDEMKSL